MLVKEEKREDRKKTNGRRQTGRQTSMGKERRNLEKAGHAFPPTYVPVETPCWALPGLSLCLLDPLLGRAWGVRAPRSEPHQAVVWFCRRTLF